ncbi:helix-turn-helix domain-containing protein [Enterococcus plantarum]|uniref:helix-turn-helix domain-containing protein n=1 Tax=Enterococcus plantarum TaxID=1077675 RepID=UPI001A902F23|nr:helix-turn-helix domain-containing protein [Enterococcus plantarum]MBO0422314.1 helix-turn-helix domain-containing protein [Enterococcus plantarum]
MKSLSQLFIQAKNGSEQAVEELILRFYPLMNKMAWKSGEYDEDCYQECMLAFVIAIGKFEIR